LLVVWNVAPARSPASMGPSSGNTLRVDSVFNIDLDDEKQFAVALVRYSPDKNSLERMITVTENFWWTDTKPNHSSI